MLQGTKLMMDFFSDKTYNTCDLNHLLHTINLLYDATILGYLFIYVVNWLHYFNCLLMQDFITSYSCAMGSIRCNSEINKDIYLKSSEVHTYCILIILKFYFQELKGIIIED